MYSIVSLQASASGYYTSSSLDLNKGSRRKMELQASVYYHVSGTEKMGGPLVYSWQTRQFQATSLSTSIDLTRSPDLKLCPPANSYATKLLFSSHSTSDQEDSPEGLSMIFWTGIGKYEFWAALEPIWNPKVTYSERTSCSADGFHPMVLSMYIFPSPFVCSTK
jgi:hypothetical protein